MWNAKNTQLMKSDEIVFRSNNSYYDDPDVYCYTCSKPLQIAYSVENKNQALKCNGK